MVLSGGQKQRVAVGIGAPAMNFIHCKVDSQRLIMAKYLDKLVRLQSKEVIMGIRPEDIYDTGFAQAVAQTGDCKRRLRLWRNLVRRTSCILINQVQLSQPALVPKVGLCPEIK